MKIPLLFSVSFLQAAALSAQVLPARAQLAAMAVGITAAPLSGDVAEVPSAKDIRPIPGVPTVNALAAAPADGRVAAIIEKTLAHGLVSEPNGNIPAGRSLSDISGPMAGQHKADYFSVWGYTDEAGLFVPGSVTMVSENWTITFDGNWRIDQWQYWLDLDGFPQKNMHRVIEEAKNGAVLSLKSEQPGVDDPAAQANRGALIEKWSR